MKSLLQRFIAIWGWLLRVQLALIGLLAVTGMLSLVQKLMGFWLERITGDVFLRQVFDFAGVAILFAAGIVYLAMSFIQYCHMAADQAVMADLQEPD